MSSWQQAYSQPPAGFDDSPRQPEDVKLGSNPPPGYEAAPNPGYGQFSSSPPYTTQSTYGQQIPYGAVQYYPAGGNVVFGPPPQVLLSFMYL